jgi:transcriptional regulator with XRE-family HTH domain
MSDYSDKLSDSEKFVIILQKYCNQYTTQKSLAQEMGIPKQSISDWKNHNRTIRIKNRNSISKKFRLTDRIWLDTFNDAVNFEEQLDSYKIIEKNTLNENSEKEIDFIAKNIIYPVNEITAKEQTLLTVLDKNQTIKYNQHNIETKSSTFLFALSKLLKNRNQIEEALEVLAIIQNNEGSFKYNHHNEIEHLKAILFSHQKIENWDKSIDILRLLYVAQYHTHEPEVITLLASNYKRKALYHSEPHLKWIEKENIDTNLLSSAMILYREAYEAKNNQKRYYDAINFAYLYKISNALEGQFVDGLELAKMYHELMTNWTIKTSNWWEVSSHAEFLMLLGDDKLAIHHISTFLEEQSVEKFNIETTLRQLELYLHVSNDTYAEEFYKYLLESWKHIQES